VNTLSFRTSDDNGLSIELLVDGEPLMSQSSDETCLPFWLCEDGIPTFPPYDEKSSRLIVGVCGCGEYGCSNTNVEFRRASGTVSLDRFCGNGHSSLSALIFADSQFDEVCRNIRATVIAYKDKK
jgi:hypothetical protein